MRKTIFCLGVLVTTMLPLRVDAALQIPWFSIDGGGELYCFGGVFELSGTIGQWDASRAGRLSGGEFHLTGGFWALTATPDAVRAGDRIFRDGFETPPG
jgi:hypothetical protein